MGSMTTWPHNIPTHTVSFLTEFYQVKFSSLCCALITCFTAIFHLFTQDISTAIFSFLLSGSITASRTLASTTKLSRSSSRLKPSTPRSWKTWSRPTRATWAWRCCRPKTWRLFKLCGRTSWSLRGTHLMAISMTRGCRQALSQLYLSAAIFF